MTGAIDVHAHHVPREWEDWSRKFGGGRWPRIVHDGCGAATMYRGETFFRKITDQCWLPERRIEDMDRLGIARQAISPVPVMFSYWAEPEACRAFARMQNENTAAIVARHPERFSGLATVPLQDTDLAIAELRHARETLGLAGVEIGTCPGGREFDDPPLFPFFEACQDLGAAVFVHPEHPLAGDGRLGRFELAQVTGYVLETGLAATRLVLGGVLERLPQLRVCLAHGGGAFPWILGRLTHAHAHVERLREALAVSPRESARRLWFDTLTHDPANLRYLVEAFGHERLMLGSDYPFVLGVEDPRAALGAAGFAPGVEAAIGAENAREFLGMP